MTEQLTRLYVGNLDYRMPIQEVELLFAQFGIVEDVFLPGPADEGSADQSRVNRGFAFVTYSAPSAAQTAVENLHRRKEHKFNRRLVVQPAKPRPAKE